jgi:aminopeptidase-like protein
MKVTATKAEAGPADVGQRMYSMIEELFPICRSITGDGVRRTLRILQNHVPLELREVTSGTQVFDWTVPREWNIRDAWVKNSRGEKIIDFQKNNLHVVNYSIPCRGMVTLDELKRHLHSLPDYPDWIPYRTSYYQESWGFCTAHRQVESLNEGSYEVCIDSSLEPGSLTYGEYFLEGATSEEVLVSCHICHPSLANDNLSGVALAVALAKQLQESERRYSYRFLFIPGTIGAIAWLSLHERQTASIRHGLVLAGVGDRGPLTYKRSRQATAEIDRAASHVLEHCGIEHRMLDFSPLGYDERQFCSPGINLPAGRLSRSQYGTFPEYHTSADNLDFVHPESLRESFDACFSILSILEKNAAFLNLQPKCEPQLGKRGLYRGMGGKVDSHESELAMLWVLNLSDGSHTLLEIAERSGLTFASVHQAAQSLLGADLLKEVHASADI